MKLVMWLPGEAAKDNRSKISETITRHLAGDQTLHAEINKNASSSSPLNVLARESQAAGGPCQVEIPVAYAVEVVQNEAEVGQKRKLDLEHFERINEAMQEFVTGREKCIEVEGRFQTCLNNTGKEMALLQEKIEKGAGIARNSVVANMECLGQVDLDLHGDPAMRLLRGMAVACGMAVQMIGSEGVAFRQATLASLTAHVPVPVQPVQAIPVPVQPVQAIPVPVQPAQAIPVPVQSVEQAVPEPVQRLQAVAASAPDFVPSLPVPVPAPAKQQYTFGYIFVCLMKKSRLSLGAFKALAAHVSRRYQGKYKRPSTWLGNTHVYAEDEVEDVKAWVNEWMAV